jgi:hypothetical protein
VADLRDVIVKAQELCHHAVRHVLGELLVDQRRAHEAVGQERHCAAAMAENPTDVAIALRRAAEQKIGDGARGIEAVFEHVFVHAGKKPATAERRLGMHEDHGAAAVEFGHDWIEGRVAEPFVAIAREQRDAVGMEHIEPVFDLGEARVDKRQRDRGKYAEAARIIARKLGRIVVRLAR